jgi:hypothetical protein
MSDHDNPHRAEDPEPPAPDPVTGSTEHTTGTEQAAENRENEPPA